MSTLFSPNKKEQPKDNQYTKKVLIPHYEPSKIQPHIASLADFDKYIKLLRAINKSSVSEEEKKFLRHAASRHIVFNYSNIADYYAHASPEMQDLMEQSALVMLDIEDAIAHGYVKLSSSIRKILEQSGEKANA